MFEKGNKLAGSRRGRPNKKTDQWVVFAEYCLNGGLERFREEMDKLDGKEFVRSFIYILDYFKPRLNRLGVSAENESISDFIEKMNKIAGDKKLPESKTTIQTTI